MSLTRAVRVLKTARVKVGYGDCIVLHKGTVRLVKFEVVDRYLSLLRLGIIVDADERKQEWLPRYGKQEQVRVGLELTEIDLSGGLG